MVQIGKVFWVIMLMLSLASCADKNKLFTSYGTGGASSSLDYYSENGFRYINIPSIFIEKETEIKSLEMARRIDPVADFMMNNSGVYIELVPSECEYLKEGDEFSVGYKRAEAIRGYLMGRGVELYRVRIAKCDTNEPHTILRDRVLFKILPYEHRIRPDDKISVSIWNHPDLSIGSIFGIYNANEVTRKWVLVDGEGNITLPQIGDANVLGKTVKEVNEMLIEMYTEHIVDPKIVVQVLNREITLLGEVNIPGTYKLEKERNSLIEVIGKAGGMKYYADRKNIQLIRKKSGGYLEVIIDLTDINTLRNMDLNLQSGDIIYVPPLDAQKVERKAQSFLPFASIMSSIVLAISVLGTMGANN